MDQFFDDNVRPVTSSVYRSLSSSPALNVVEHKDRYEVLLSIPGIEPNKVKVEITERVLTVSYTHSEEEKEEGDLLRQEYSSYYSFSRSVALPKNVDEDSINAKYKNGILTVTVQKLPQTQPRSVDIDITE